MSKHPASVAAIDGAFLRSPAPDPCGPVFAYIASWATPGCGTTCASVAQLVVVSAGLSTNKPWATLPSLRPSRPLRSMAQGCSERFFVFWYSGSLDL